MAALRHCGAVPVAAGLFPRTFRDHSQDQSRRSHPRNAALFPIIRQRRQSIDVAQQLRFPALGQAVCDNVSPLCRHGAHHHGALPVAGIPDGVRHCPIFTDRTQLVVTTGRAAILDFIPAPRLRVDGTHE